MSELQYVSPIAYPQWWDVVVIAGVTSPGLAIVGEWKRTHTWDVKKGKGTLGASLVFTQKPPAEGPIEFQLWDDGTGSTGHNHFAEWDAFIQLLKYDPTKKTAAAVSIWHPSLDFIDVSSVVTTKIGNPIHKGEGLYSITIDFIEDYPVPAKNATGTVSTTKTTAGPPASAGGNPPPDAPDAYQQQIAALLQQAQG